MGRGPIARLLVMKVDLVGSIGSSLGGGGAFVCWQTDGAIDSLQTDYSYANQPSVGHTRSGAPPPSLRSSCILSQKIPPVRR